MTVPATFAEVRQKIGGPNRLSELFHLVNRILPEDQEIISLPPEATAGYALKLMQEHGFSQIPVVAGDSVLGLFSYRAFALEVANSGDPNLNAISLSVEEFLEHEKPEYALLEDEFRGLISILDEKDSVVISGPERLLGILTPMDVLRYLYSVANGFVLVEEIELAIRALIREALPNAEMFSNCVKTVLSSKYDDEKLPQSLEEMAFDDYIWLVRDGRTWEYFSEVFGGTRARVGAKLEPIRDLRNDVFHFRRELSAADHQQLSACRDWALTRIRKVQSGKGGVQ